MQYVDQDLVLEGLVVLCNQDCLLTLHILGNAIGVRLVVLAMGNADCFLSGTDYRNKRQFLCLGEHPSVANV